MRSVWCEISTSISLPLLQHMCMYLPVSTRVLRIASCCQHVVGCDAETLTANIRLLLGSNALGYYNTYSMR